MGWTDRVVATVGVAGPSGSGAGRPRRETTNVLARLERWLWALAGLGFVADLVLTLVGLRLGMTEANPVVVAAIGQVGPLWGLLGLKIGALAFAVGISRRISPTIRPVVPLALGLTWLAAAGVNMAGLAAAF